MAWRYELDLSDIWEAAWADEITAQELALRVAARIRAMETLPSGRKIHAILAVFEELAEDETATFYDIDGPYNALCDWGDWERVWIKTMG